MSQGTTVSPLCTRHTRTASCVSRWYVDDTEYPRAVCTYKPLVNGKEAFEAVYKAIEQAKKSVDIICWGFQPSMYFIRDEKALRIGDLLIQMASKVEVRVLGWEYPFNATGLVGEANLPGKGGLADRAGQNSTDEQYAYDRWWFDTHTVKDHTSALKVNAVPLFASRGFGFFERFEIMYQAALGAVDLDLSKTTVMTMGAAPSHHQKTVLIDYEVAEHAIGFVMGHNMLDEYWDTDEHTAHNRTEKTKPKPNAGPRGNTPRQDISCQVSGPILEHLHHNFAVAWREVSGVDLLTQRNAKQVGPTLQCLPGQTPQLAQLLRTQPQEDKRDIEKVYLQAVNNAVRFIYIENQYFRWPPLAELIKKIANSHTDAGRDPGVHGHLHLFVITNVSDEGIGQGIANTQRMVESLGRADTMPNVTKLQRIEQVKKNAPAKPPEPSRPVELNEYRARLDQWQAEQDRQIKEVNDSIIEVDPPPLLKVHVCSLVAPDSPAGKPWMPVYIHSKLMIVDDVFTTHGSANINTRSMQVDSEMNIAHDWADASRALRRRLWKLHTKGKGDQDEPAVAFDAWQKILTDNKNLINDNKSPCASLVEFFYDKRKLSDQD